MPRNPSDNPGVWQRNGNGTLRDLVFRNVAIETQFATPLDFWGSGEPIVVTSVPSDAASARAGLRGIRNVTFENIAARSQGGALISTWPAVSPGWAPLFPGRGAVADVVLRNVSITIAADVGNVTAAARAGHHDFRPVDPPFSDPALFAAGAGGAAPAPVDGLFVDGDASVTLDGVRIAFDDGGAPGGPPKAWSMQCLNATARPTVRGTETLQCHNETAARR